MAFFVKKDLEREILEEYYQKQSLSQDALEEAIAQAKARMAKGFPMAYIVGEAAFYDLVFKVNDKVLIPRPDTERLVEKAIDVLPKGARFLELGVGSGCITLTILKHRPDLTAIAMDISKEALLVAEENAKRLGLFDRVRFLLGDMKEGLAERFDFVLSNPPYIPGEDIAQYPSLGYEPLLALDGGKDGMDFYRAILDKYKSGGFLLEIGFDQGRLIEALAQEKGYTCEVYKDYGKNDRVALLYPKNNLC